MSFPGTLLTIPAPHLELLSAGGQEYILSDMESHLLYPNVATLGPLKS